MENYSIPNVLSSQIFETVLEKSPFANRAERIRKTLLELHHQYLELKLIGQSTGPDIDISLLEETAYWLSGVATTPGREETLSKNLKAEMLSVSALIFEYLGDLSRASIELQNIDNHYIYYLDASLCNSLSTFEANSIAISRKYLQNLDELIESIDSNNGLITQKDCLNIIYIWLARDMSFLWVQRKKTESAIERTNKYLNEKLLEEEITRTHYNEMSYWLKLIKAIIDHSRYFQFGKTSYLVTSNGLFENAILSARTLGNPPLVWTTIALIKCAELMTKNSVWKRLGNIFSKRYIRRLVTSNPPVLELWSSQIAALNMDLEMSDGSQIQLENGYLDDRIKRVAIGMPTTSGKTLLAELAILKILFPSLETKRPTPNTTCIYVVPTIALANQIEHKLSSRLLPLGIRATAVIGGYDSAFLDDTIFNKTTVGVVTPEKLDMLIRQDHPFIKQCELYIFDEVHKLDNNSRGFTMEMIITWLKDFHQKAQKAKMIFISAMMPNNLEIEQWINNDQINSDTLPAISINLDWRPTRQIKGIIQIDKDDLIESNEIVVGTRSKRNEFWFGAHLSYVNDEIDLSSPRQIRRIIKFREVRRLTKERKEVKDSKFSYGTEETAAELAKVYLNAGFDPILVFFMAKNETRKFCEYLASEDYSPKSLEIRDKEQYEGFLSFIRERLGDAHPISLFAPKGIAYHHGSLPKDIRAEIEYAFSKKWLRVLASTTTLTDGVNFPISTFILANYEKTIGVNKNGEPIYKRLGKKDFQNMIGRAGRAIYETEGQIVFLTPISGYQTNPKWKDYFFQKPDDPESQISSSLSSNTFSFDILQNMLDALDSNKDSLQFLTIDPEKFEASFGFGTREVGELILRLQAFLLALMDRDILDANTFETFLKFLDKTLFGKQIQERSHIEIFAKFMQETGKVMKVAEPSNDRRSAYSKTGLGFNSCKALYDNATSYWETLAKLHFEKDIQHINEEFLRNIGDFVFSLPETKPELTKVPRTRPTHYISLSHGELLVDWVINNLSIQDLREKYFGEISDIGESIESCINYVRDAFEYKGPWVISAYNLFLSKIAQNESFQNSSLYRQLSMLPAYIKFGVNNPAAAFFSMIGINTREVCIILSNKYNSENPERSFDFSKMLVWLFELEPENVNIWFETELGEGKIGYVARLFRYIDLIRSQEQNLVDLLPLEVSIAGWQYYEGTKRLKILSVGDTLTLKLDTLNPWDSYAVEVLDNSQNKLGYIPRQYSRAVFQHLQSDQSLSCKIFSIDRFSEKNPIRIILETEQEF